MRPLPPRVLLGQFAGVWLGRRVSLARHAGLMVAALRPRPVVHGLCRVPRDGPFVLLANHYQRPDLWIGWAGALLLWSVRRVRRGDPPLVVGAIDRVVLASRRGRAVELLGSRFILGRAIRMYGMLPVPPDGPTGGAPARALLRAGLPPPRGEGRPLLIFPEGHRGEAGRLKPARPGVGSLLMRLAGAGVPSLPGAVWEDARGRLHASFGRAYLPGRPAGVSRAEADRLVAGEAMARIAALLPPDQR